MFITIFINEKEKIIVDNSDIKLIIKDGCLYKVVLKDDGGIYHITKNEFERLELLLTSDFSEMLNRIEDIKKLNEEMGLI